MNQQPSESLGLKLSQEAASLSAVYKEPGDFFVRETTRLLHIQDDAMTRQAAAWNGWMDRRHAGISSTVEMLEQMNQSTKPEEVMHLQRKLLAGYCERWTRDVTVATEGLFAAYQRRIFALHAMMTGSFPSLTVPSKPKVEAGFEPVKAGTGAD
jgi:hypothetical protein